MRHFTVSDIRYLWTGNSQNLLKNNKKTLASITAHTDDIDFTAENPEHSDESIWDRLRKAGLIFTRHVKGEGVKFYTALKQIDAGAMSTGQELRAILNAMDESGMASHSSLYLGEGHLADYLVRCVADSYSEVLNLVEAFDIRLKETRLRPMTLLIANTHARESDHINDVKPGIFLDDNTLQLLDLDDHKILDRLTVPERIALHELLVHAYALSPPECILQAILREVLVAVIKNSRSDLQKALSFMLEFEVYFSKYLLRELRATFGKDWQADIRNECKTSKHQRWKDHASKMDQKIKDWTLGTYVFTAMAASELKPVFASQIIRQLGPDWNKQASALPDLRNAVGHGRLHKIKLDTFDASLIEFLHEVMSAADFWSRCVDAAEKPEGLTNDAE